MIKVHKKKKKVSIVTDPKNLESIAMCLAESPVLNNRILAHQLIEAVKEMNENEKS